MDLLLEWKKAEILIEMSTLSEMRKKYLGSISNYVIANVAPFDHKRKKNISKLNRN